MIPTIKKVRLSPGQGSRHLQYLVSTIGLANGMVVITPQSIISDSLFIYSYADVIFTNTSFACINGDEDILRDVEIIFCIPETLPSNKDNKTDLAMQEGGVEVFDLLLHV